MQTANHIIDHTEQEQAENIERELTSEEETEIIDIKSMKGENAFTIKLDVNNQNIDFEIDTGSSITIISEKVYQHQLSKEAPLERTNTILKTYSGEQLPVTRRFQARIKHNGEVHNILINVVKGNGSCLLRRDFS